MTLIQILLIIGTLIILVLAAIALNLSLKVRKQIKHKESELLELEKKQRETQQKLLDDCQFVAKALISGQCELTEACLRIITLRDHLPEHLRIQLCFPAMQAVYDTTWQLPTHQAYKDLDKQTRFKQDNIRLKTEAEYDTEVRKEAAALHSKIEQLTQLH